jgi:hypothetical protein
MRLVWQPEEKPEISEHASAAVCLRIDEVKVGVLEV